MIWIKYQATRLLSASSRGLGKAEAIRIAAWAQFLNLGGDVLMLGLGDMAGCRVIRSAATSSTSLLLQAASTQAENAIVFERALPGR